MLINLTSTVNSARTISSKLYSVTNKLNLFNQNSNYFLAKRQYRSFSVNNFDKQNILCKLSNNSNRKFSTTAINMIETFNNIVKSGKDQRLYRGLVLDNHMKCLLISDPSTDRSAASVDVHVGYMLDPKEFPGLAHFCEHMLFMGSDKYPVENYYSKFIEDHAGSTNAYTSNENTNYHFEIATSQFKEALDIFAQFFIAPTFSPGSVDREILAVDSENQKNLQVDPWRINQLDKSTSREDHPYSKFGTGNLNTLKTKPEELGLNVREELIRFHKKYYSSNLMTLCLLGKESLEELEKYAVDMFTAVPNKNLKKVDFDSDPYLKDGTYVYNVVPVQDLRQLSLSWVIPDSRDIYQANPSNYISHLIGHEGKGSLLSELKKKGWCSNLYAGARREARGFQFFNLIVDLSEEGGEKVQEIIKLVFQYFNMQKQQDIQKWVYDEINSLGKIKFEFKDKEKPINYVSSLTSDMHVHGMEDVLSANYYLTKYDPDAIKDLYKYLTPEKMKVAVISKKYEGNTDKKEQWYDTEYSEQKLAKEQLDALNSCGLNENLSIPPVNAFIPNDLNIIKHQNPENLPKFPRIIQSSALTRLWYKEDLKFLLPKAYLKFELRNPLVYFDPVTVNMTNLFIELFRDALVEQFYDADLAGLNFRMNPSNYGMTIHFSGFNDKMNVLVNDFFGKLANFRVDPKRFEILKESYQRELTNFEAEQPYQHSLYYMTLLLSEKGWSKKQLLNTINDFTLEDLQQFIPKLLTQNVFIESLMYGNLSEQNARDYLQIVENKLKSNDLIKSDKLRPLEKSHSKNFRQVKLPEGCNAVYTKANHVHKTNAIEVYYQCGAQTLRENAMVELFCQVIGEACFNVLRTQEQLGYIVASGVRNFGGVQGIRVIVQSDKSPAHLDERIENFIKITKETIGKMTDEEFKTHVDALILTKLEEPKKMSKQSDIYWNEIMGHQYNFDRENAEVAELKTFNKDDLATFFKDLVDPESKNRKKLAIYIHPPEIGCELTADKINAELVEDIHEWQNGMHLYPLQKPFTSLNTSQ